MSATVHHGMPIEQYFALPGEHASGLRALAISPKQYAWQREHGKPDKDTLRVGRAVHTSVLEPQRFRAEYVVWEGGRRYGHEWNAFQVEHQGRTILTLEQHERALAVAEAVRSHPVASALLAETGTSEVTITWTHARTGIVCKARPDRLCSALVELKTCRDPAPHMFESAAARLGYHIQVAFYGAAVLELEGVAPPARIIAAQNQPPFDVAVYDVPEDVLVAGERQYEAALDTLLRCRRTGTWPGIAPDGHLLLHLPSWAAPQEEELTFDGEAMFGGAA